MKGKTAVITGAARGIGLGIARMFAGQGMNLSICGTSQKTVDAALAELKDFGVSAYGAVVDVSNSAGVEKFIAESIKNLGKIDVLVNNAGITRDNLAVRMSEEDWDKVLDINLKGAFLVSKFVLKHMMKERSGSVINITSAAGQSGNAGQANYSAAKAGMIGLTKSLAKEFASRGVRVNAVAPGFVETDMTRALDQKVKEAAIAAIPLKRFADVSDIAKAVLFLAGGDSSYITGQVLAVNGGLYI